MIPLLIILLTINGVITMRGDSSSDVKFSEFIVSIWYFHEHRCTGSILDETHILTAGYCVNDLSISLLSVTAGIITSDPRNIQKIRVKKIHLHPDFRAGCHPNDLYWENDIAIIELSEELKWDSTVAAVPLIDTEYNWNPCDLCGIFGWDDAAVQGFKSLTLRWSQAMVLEDRKCRELKVSLWKNTKCLINRYRNIVLENGDYGGPVICGSNAVGILINGGQNRNSPPVLLSIYPYLRFIADILHVGEINNPSGNFVHYVAILHLGSYNCGGSIIDSTHILTAAHCVEGGTREALIVIRGLTEIRLGTLSLTQALMIIMTQGLVDRIQVHPEYEHSREGKGKWKFVRNDIAVLTACIQEPLYQFNSKLQRPLEWNADIKPVPLSRTLPFGEECQVYRWSRTISRDGGTLLKAMWSSTRIRDPYTCKAMNPLLDSNRFCTVNLYALPIASKGDSGSPIICDGLLVGILSTHTLGMRLDGPYQALFFTAVAPYLDFINDNTRAAAVP